MTEALKVKKESGENWKVLGAVETAELVHIRERAAAFLESEGKFEISRKEVNTPHI